MKIIVLIIVYEKCNVCVVLISQLFGCFVIFRYDWRLPSSRHG